VVVVVVVVVERCVVCPSGMWWFSDTTPQLSGISTLHHYCTYLWTTTLCGVWCRCLQGEMTCTPFTYRTLALFITSPFALFIME